MKRLLTIAADLEIVSVRTHRLATDVERRQGPRPMSVEQAVDLIERADELERMLNACKVEIVEHKRAALKTRSES